MFKSLTGFKKVVREGINAVADQSTQLTDRIVQDPSTSKENIKSTIRDKLKGGLSDVKEHNYLTGDNAPEALGATKEKAQEVATKVKHYGAFGEDYLGYTDPTKDLRKAVKQREKAAKKARKLAKKNKGKKEDLFDPANLEKYKRELEAKKKEEQCKPDISVTVTNSNEAVVDNENEEEFNFYRSSSEDEVFDTNEADKTDSTKEPEEWNSFLSITRDVDSLVRKSQEGLAHIQEESFYKPRPSTPEENEEEEEEDKGDQYNQEGLVETDSVEAKREAEDKEGEDDEERTVSDEEDAQFVAEFDIEKVKLAVVEEAPFKFADGCHDDPFDTAVADTAIKKKAAADRAIRNKQQFGVLSDIAKVLESTPVPVRTVPSKPVEEVKEEDKEDIDEKEKEESIEEEVDDEFGDDFDELAKDSAARTHLEEFEKQFADEDAIFDTTDADRVLVLNSLTKADQDKVELPDDILDDPFDTSHYSKVTDDIDADFEFESLAKRFPPHNSSSFKATEGTENTETEAQSAEPEVEATPNAAWFAFGQKPPRPKPPPPRSCNRDNTEEADDPFDTDKYHLDDKVDIAQIEAADDPFDTTSADDKVDERNKESITSAHILAEETSLVIDQTDPFDTDFAAEVLPNRGDPFDTTYLENKKPEKNRLPENHSSQPSEAFVNNDQATEAYDPASAFKSSCREVDPFDTSIAENLL